MLLAIGLPALAAEGAGIAPLAAFPGAEGFGATTTHARGRPVCRVTRLADPAPALAASEQASGTFRHCLATADELGGGYIVFAVSGTIELRRSIHIPSRTYVAGQTSPGGIAFTGGTLILGDAHDIVIRHIRHRESARISDAIRVQGARRAVIDHVSVSAFKDGAIDFVDGARDITVQWSHLGDAVDSGDPLERYHGQPHLIRTWVDRVTLHHNLYTHGHTRMPLVVESVHRPGFLIEFSNNVIYNYGKFPSRFAARGGFANIVGNIYIPGVNTHADATPNGKLASRTLWQGKPLPAGVKPPIVVENGTAVYLRDNLMLDGLGHVATIFTDRFGKQVELGRPSPVTGVRTEATQPESRVAVSRDPRGTGAPRSLHLLDRRIAAMPPLTLHPATENLAIVLRKFGAWPRDATDLRLAREVHERRGRWKYRLPDDANHYRGDPPPDSDGDGLPDAFEARLPGDITPAGRDLNPMRDNIEIYLDERHAALMMSGGGE